MQYSELKTILGESSELSAIVGNRIHSIQAPRSAELPLIVLSMSDGPESPDGSESYNVNATIYGADNEEGITDVLDAGEVLKVLLRNTYNRQVGQTYIEHCKKQGGEQSFQTFEDSEDRWFGYSLDYVVTVDTPA